MNTSNRFELPDLILLSSFDGDIQTYFEAVYQVFKADFVLSKPVFRGTRLGLKKYPLVDGKEYTFYHFTHSGMDEQARTPDLRRMERIRFPRPMIDGSQHPYLKVWKNKRGTNERFLIYHEEENYVVVLDQRKDYLLPWTAYTVDYPNQKRKLLKEYEDYLRNAETAQ
jgi:hypothetical protein